MIIDFLVATSLVVGLIVGLSWYVHVLRRDPDPNAGRRVEASGWVRAIIAVLAVMFVVVVTAVITIAVVQGSRS